MAFLFVVVFSVLSFSGKAQNDSDIYKNRFKNNLNELSKLYCFTDFMFYQGKFRFQQIGNVEEEFRKLELSVFSEISDKTADYYCFFNELTEENQQNLIRLFSFYENDIEEILKKAELPDELKYLAPAISAMNLRAAGENGRFGVWQLAHFQAVLNGAVINKLVDERFNVSVSTFAAAAELKQNLIQFETLELAIAAYLLGNVKVKNALQNTEYQSSENDAVDFLPNSLNEFIASFQAMAIFLSVNIFEEKIEPFTVELKPDTVIVNRQLHFQQVSKVIGVSENELRFFNPQFKFSIISGNEKPVKLILPNGKRDDFIIWQDSIYNTYDSTLFHLVTQKIEYPPSPTRQYVNEPVKDLEIEGKTKIQYRLKTGDVLGIIAEDFDVRVADLKYWNNIYNERKIQAGKKLDIFVDEDKVDYYSELATPQKLKKEENSMVEQNRKTSTLKIFENLNAAKKIEHIVKSGESPYLIAKIYDGVTPDEILEWNNIDDARKIQIGQKLIVYLK